MAIFVGTGEDVKASEFPADTELFFPSVTDIYEAGESLALSLQENCVVQ